MSPSNSRWLFMLKHTAEEKSKLRDSGTEGKAWILHADRKVGSLVTMVPGFLILLHKVLCQQLKRLPANRDSLFHFEDGFPQVATYALLYKGLQTCCMSAMWKQLPISNVTSL